MAQLESGLYQRLIADASVAALVGCEIYAIIMPDDPVLPAITYQRISTVREYATTGPTSLTRIRIQIDAWAMNYGAVKNIAKAVRDSLELFRGNLPDGTFCDSIELDSSTDLYDDAARYYRVQSDYIIYAVE